MILKSDGIFKNKLKPPPRSRILHSLHFDLREKIRGLAMGARNEIMPISARTALRSTLLDVSLKIELDCRCLNPQTRKSIRVNCFKPLTVSFTN